MQKVTGTLNPGGHPGSYNGQDAYNDLLVVDDGKNVGRNTDSTNAVSKELWGGKGCRTSKTLMR